MPTDKTFTSQRLDTTGLYFYNARYFDPELGRFISPDTIIPDYKNPQSLNRYSYVYSNPLKYSDPSGHFPWLIVLVVILIISEAVDYGWTVYDATKDIQILSDPQSSDIDKQVAEFDLALCAAMEGIEPDEYLPGGLPLDDVARRKVKNELKENLSNNTVHGEQRLIERGFTKQDIDYTKSTNNVKTQADGAMVYIKEVNPSKYNVIVEGENGIITGLKNIDQKALDNLSKNYGWR